MNVFSYMEATVSVLMARMQTDSRLCVVGFEPAAGRRVENALAAIRQRFPQRVQAIPFCERGVMGLCIGACIAGARPVVDLIPADLLLYSLGDLMHQVTPIRALSNGRLNLAPVVRAITGAYLSSGPFLSGHSSAALGRVAGWRIAAPMSVKEGCALLDWALRHDEPTLLLEHRRLLELSEPLDRDELVSATDEDPWSAAPVLSQGHDVTLISYGFLSTVALEAAMLLGQQGVSVETIHLRGLLPWDRQTLMASLAKTGRLAVLEDMPRWGSFLDAIVLDAIQYTLEWLDIPPLRIHTPADPAAYSPALERFWQPTAEAVSQAMQHWLES